MGAPSKTVQVSDSFFYPENEEKDEKTTTPSFIFDAFEFALVVASYKFSFSDSCTSPVLAVVSFTVKIVLIDASRRRGHSFTPFFIWFFFARKGNRANLNVKGAASVGWPVGDGGCKGNRGKVVFLRQSLKAFDAELVHGNVCLKDWSTV